MTLQPFPDRGLAALLVALVLASFAPIAKADIVVGDDVNTFGTFLAGMNETTFAVNVANELTAGRSKSLLMFESAPGDGSRDYSPAV